ncbi:MAG: hypothetical protein DRI83_01990 [Bacteroidetes bacterium]|nr:MAG: hypothetical protein DRI83_01990 [Bacteroidota bacterium]
MEIKKGVSTVLGEITKLLEFLDSREVIDFTKDIVKTKRVFVAGSGRALLLSKCFAKRLSHAEVDVSVIGETTTPPVTAGELVIVASCSGESVIPLAITTKAKQMGAMLWGITACPDSSIAKQCNRVLILSSSGYKQDDAKVISAQPMNNLFEQGLHIVFDIVSWSVQKEKGISDDKLCGHHTNIE